MVALSISAGCSQVSQVQAKRSFKAANAAYQSQDYKKSAALYEETLQEDPSIAAAHFFLANSLDNQYKPSRKGEPANDELMTKAVENYKLGAEKLAGSAVEDERKLAKDVQVKMRGTKPRREPAGEGSPEEDNHCLRKKGRECSSTNPVFVISTPDRCYAP